MADLRISASVQARIPALPFVGSDPDRLNVLTEHPETG